MSRRGVTFVELLIAITIFAILSVGLSTHLRAATIAWRRAISDTETAQERRIALAQLERDFANAVLYDSTGEWTPAPAFGGSQLQWYVRQPGPQKTAAIRFVSYALDGDRLTRRLMTPLQAHAGSASTEPSVMLQGLASFGARYAVLEPSDEGVTMRWYDSWTQEGVLPGLVEIQLTMQDAAGGGQAGRIIHVPGGTLKRIETGEEP